MYNVVATHKQDLNKYDRVYTKRKWIDIYMFKNVLSQSYY